MPVGGDRNNLHEMNSSAGARHTARPEDCPVEPVAGVGFRLTPLDFFDGGSAPGLSPEAGRHIAAPATANDCPACAGTPN